VPTWKYTGTHVIESKVKQSIEAINGACFQCKIHSADCPFAKAVGEISSMLEE
jgi:hypothetical protein